MENDIKIWLDDESLGYIEEENTFDKDKYTMKLNSVELRKRTIREIIDILNNCSKYVELAEDLGVNNDYEELKKISNYISYYDIDDMVDYLWEKIGD